MLRVRRALVQGVVVASSLLLVSAGQAHAPSAGCAAEPGYARLLVAGEDLRAYYRLGESFGFSACDLAGGADGTYAGEFSLGQEGALAGSGDPAVRFSGAGTVRVRSSAALNPTGGLTVEAWVRPAAIAPSETVLRKDGQYMLPPGRRPRRVPRVDVGRLDRADARRASCARRTTSTSSACLDGDRMRIYRNGSQIASRGRPGRLNVTDSDLFLGSSSAAYDHFAGDLDEVAVYGGALSAATVSDHHTAAPAVARELRGVRVRSDSVPGPGRTGAGGPYSAASPFNRPVAGGAAGGGGLRARWWRGCSASGPIKHLEAGLADTADDFGHPTYYSRTRRPDVPAALLRGELGTLRDRGPRDPGAGCGAPGGRRRRAPDRGRPGLRLGVRPLQGALQAGRRRRCWSSAGAAARGSTATGCGSDATAAQFRQPRRASCAPRSWRPGGSTTRCS